MKYTLLYPCGYCCKHPSRNKCLNNPAIKYCTMLICSNTGEWILFQYKQFISKFGPCGTEHQIKSKSIEWLGAQVLNNTVFGARFEPNRLDQFISEMCILHHHTFPCLYQETCTIIDVARDSSLVRAYIETTDVCFCAIVSTTMGKLSPPGIASLAANICRFDDRRISANSVHGTILSYLSSHYVDNYSAVIHTICR